MELKSFLVKNVLVVFFVAVACICAAMAVLGMLFEPDARFGYEGFLSPLLFGAATMLPVLVGYSRRELSIREVLARKAVQLALIEFIVLLMVYSTGSLAGVFAPLSLALSVLMVYVTVHLILWASDRSTAKALNKAIQKMQRDIQD